MILEEQQVHETLNQRGYEYKNFLGKGGFSNVMLCYNKKYQHSFAIKKAIKHSLSQEEHSHLIKLDHPYIIKLYDSFEDDSSHYLVMEYCTNGTIKEKGCLSYEKFIYYAKQILQAIAFCHSNGIAHRDIKPENIFVDEYDHAKLADFGMAKKFQINGKSNEKCGSLMFLPPEMLQRQEICPFKADIWALGITFFFMATGQYPFQASSREELAQKIFRGEIDYNHYPIHPKIRLLLKRMTSKNLENRPNADNILEMPMFTANNSILPLLREKNPSKLNLANYHTQSKLKLSQTKANEPKLLNSNLTARNLGINTYRNISIYPGFRCSKTHFLPSKIF